MTVVLWIVAAALIAVGVAGLVLPVLPGPLLLFAGLWMAAWLEGFAHVGAAPLVFIGALAAVASLTDFLAGALFARRRGASASSVAGATLGAVVGVFFGPVGLLLGPFVGAVLGELWARRGLPAAGRAGWSATLGLLLGMATKVALGVAMVAIFLVVRF